MLKPEKKSTRCCHLSRTRHSFLNFIHLSFLLPRASKATQDSGSIFNSIAPCVCLVIKLIVYHL